MDHDGPAAWTIGIGVTVLVVSAILIVAMDSCSGFGNGLLVERKHLQPIPIARSACPYVVAMHSTANAFQSAEPALFGVYQGPGNSMIEVRWPRVRARLQKTLLDL